MAYVVLDGAGDGFGGGPCSLEVAVKPVIDGLAGHSVCGLVYTVGRGVAPESDVAVLSLLGYDPVRYYTGRGPLEALGAGIPFREGWLALRANFATVDPRTLRIIDRRTGRSLTTWEARLLAEAVDGMDLDGGRAKALFKATIGHRGVLVIKHETMKLSADITNTDPAYERRGPISHARKQFEPYIQEAKPLTSNPGAVLAAKLVNEFTRRAIEILDTHPVNQGRRERGLPPANAILLRDAGDRLPAAEPFKEKHGIEMASIVEMVVERGIARALGLKDLDLGVDPQEIPRNELLAREAELAAKALEEYSGVYVHLKGPDEPGHDGDLEEKVRAIEDIDRFFFRSFLNRINPEETLIIVTSDHATPWYMKAHSDDPVPLMFSNPGIETGHKGFNEKECEKGELGILEKGYMIVPRAIEYMKRLEG